MRSHRGRPAIAVSKTATTSTARIPNAEVGALLVSGLDLAIIQAKTPTTAMPNAKIRIDCNTRTLRQDLNQLAAETSVSISLSLTGRKRRALCQLDLRFCPSWREVSFP